MPFWVCGLFDRLTGWGGVYRAEGLTYTNPQECERTWALSTKGKMEQIPEA